MTDFVLRIYKTKSSNTGFYPIVRYAEFLKQPLELWMFVPCDENSNVLEEPLEKCNPNWDEDSMCDWATECFFYEEAKERCLFDGGFCFENVDNFNEWIDDNNLNNVESLLGLCFELTPTAKKQLE